MEWLYGVVALLFVAIFLLIVCMVKCLSDSVNDFLEALISIWEDNDG